MNDMDFRPGHNAWKISPLTRAGLLVDGTNYYRAFYRAARKARKTILIAGWQFDSDVHLLRGLQRKPYQEARFLPFLNRLCEKNPDLRIYILAWDFSIVFTLQREWMQDQVFNWTSNDRITFRFDSVHPVGASHHQKFAIIDDELAFVGGMDLCSSRWDERSHRIGNPLRVNDNGTPYKPYHDLQSFIQGPVVHDITEIFRQRWRNSGGGELELPLSEKQRHFPLRPYLSIHGRQLALSRTQGKMLVPLLPSIEEIRQLYIEAITSARQLIYIENQYISSDDVHQALIRRMEERSEPPLEIVIILPKRFQGFFEDISMGNAQTKILRSLKATAVRTGHHLGVYYMGSLNSKGEEIGTYIHSKVLIIDDELLSVGSANTTNRSFDLDTELNLTWSMVLEEPSRKDKLHRSIRRIRASLLSEFAGRRSLLERASFKKVEGLVAYLNRLADDPKGRLHHHQMETLFNESGFLQTLTPEDMNLDPKGQPLLEKFHEKISNHPDSLFVKGILMLNDWFYRHSDQNRDEEIEPIQGFRFSLKGQLRAALLLLILLILLALLYL